MRLRREERGDTIILWHRLVPFLARVEAILALDLFLDSIALGIHLGWRGRTQSWLGTGGVTQGAVGALRVGQLLLALILELGGILQALLVVLRDGAPISETGDDWWWLDNARQWCLLCYEVSTVSSAVCSEELADFSVLRQTHWVWCQQSTVVNSRQLNV